jgi:hypothetical protein
MMFYLKAPAMLGGDKNKAELMAHDAVGRTLSADTW